MLPVVMDPESGPGKGDEDSGIKICYEDERQVSLGLTHLQMWCVSVEPRR